MDMDTSDCPAALEPSRFRDEGAVELDRFLAGARSREEVALIVAVAGDAADDSPRRSRFDVDASVDLGMPFTSVHARRLPAGAPLTMTAGLGPADRDLAMRLLNGRGAEAPWWSLRLSGPTLLPMDGPGEETCAPKGELHPILVDALGEPVVAAWTSGDQRWYIIPDDTDWNTILDWLVLQALPAYVPAALRRVRSPLFADPDLQTTEEFAIAQALTELETRYAQEKERLTDDLRRAAAAADPIRQGLLFGSGTELVDAVAAVFTDAELTVVDLDTDLGDTASADLLVSAGSVRRLVEVKGASGAASEKLVGHLERHLATWPYLRPAEPVTGGVLVVNHQHRLHPTERSERVYSRREFVAALAVPVISTVELFRWWRAGDLSAIRAAVLGAMDGGAVVRTAPPAATPVESESGRPESPPADVVPAQPAARAGGWRSWPLSWWPSRNR